MEREIAMGFIQPHAPKAKILESVALSEHTTLHIVEVPAHMGRGSKIITVTESFACNASGQIHGTNGVTPQCTVAVVG